MNASSAVKKEKTLSVSHFASLNIRNLGILALIFALLTAGYIVLIFPTIINVLFPPTRLDYATAFAPGKVVRFDGTYAILPTYFSVAAAPPATTQDPETKDDDNGDSMLPPILRGGGGGSRSGASGSSDLVPETAKNYYDAYRQNNVYTFKITPDTALETNLVFKTVLYIATDADMQTQLSHPTATHKYLLLEAGGHYIFAKVEPDAVYKPGQTYTGVLLPINAQIIAQTQSSLGNSIDLDGKLFGWQLDTITDFSEDEFYDMGWLYILLFIFILFAVPYVVFKRNPKRHMVYRQFDKLYGDMEANIAEIDSELQDKTNLVRQGKRYQTQNWIITKDFLRTKITRLPRL